MIKPMILENTTQIDDHMIRLRIDVSEFEHRVMGRAVTAIEMYLDPVRGTSGDLGVLWDTQGLEDNPAAARMNTLLMRDCESNDAITQVMNSLYWERAFTDTLRELVAQLGFSEQAAREISGSEWGMQRPGRASYDAEMLAEEVLRAWSN